jgi:hypothetical protein
MFARERADERTQLEEREAIGKVPISLSASLQVWLPIELSSVVESLWAASAVEDSHSAHNVLVWAALLRVVALTPPRLTSHVDAKALTPASRRYLLRVALDALRKALAGTDFHVALADIAAVVRNVDIPAILALVNDVVHELAAASWIDTPSFHHLIIIELLFFCCAAFCFASTRRRCSRWSRRALWRSRHCLVARIASIVSNLCLGA